MCLLGWDVKRLVLMAGLHHTYNPAVGAAWEFVLLLAATCILLEPLWELGLGDKCLEVSKLTVFRVLRL